tara:strand:+ start:26490 stop:26858 length:369 start_codon:yes stop_codon:yes gene_type:complete
MQRNDYDDFLRPKNQKVKNNEVQSEGKCPICDRDMIAGKSVDKHHFIPKLKKGKVTTLLHVICHRKLHSIFSEAEMAQYYNTPERCKEHPEVQKFIKWVSNKEPEYLESHKEHKGKKNKRKK